MNTKELYISTLLLPIAFLLVWVVAIMITRGLGYIGVLADAVLSNWYHILPAIISVVLGIEVFKRDLVLDKPEELGYWKAFKFVFKLWIIEATMNILTTLFKGGVKFSNNDYLNRLIALLAIGASLYLIVATVSSLLIAGIIYLSGKRKAIMLASNN